MNRLLLVVVSACAVSVTGGLASAGDANGEAPVAIVCSLSGEAFVQVGAGRTPLTLFMRLKPGAVVQTAEASNVVVTFFNGHRFELGQRASGAVGPDGLRQTSGPVRRLVSVPAVIEIAPIARADNPGTRLAATRIRTGARDGPVANLYPSAAAASVSDATTVRFDAVPGYERYKVDVEDATGNNVQSLETAATAIRIPRDVLQPGSSYYWRVRTMDAGKPVLQGDAVFSTLSLEDESRRRAFEAHVDASGETSLRLLLAELNRVLGLRDEACVELLAALGEDARIPANADAITRFGCSRK
jgi:hypothetical protein